VSAAVKVTYDPRHGDNPRAPSRNAPTSARTASARSNGANSRSATGRTNASTPYGNASRPARADGPARSTGHHPPSRRSPGACAHGQTRSRDDTAPRISTHLAPARDPRDDRPPEFPAPHRDITQRPPTVYALRARRRRAGVWVRQARVDAPHPPVARCGRRPAGSGACCPRPARARSARWPRGTRSDRSQGGARAPCLPRRPTRLDLRSAVGKSAANAHRGAAPPKRLACSTDTPVCRMESRRAR
jgi:hypothetical protein